MTAEELTAGLERYKGEFTIVVRKNLTQAPPLVDVANELSSVPQ